MYKFDARLKGFYCSAEYFSLAKAFEQRRRFEIKSVGMGVNDPNFKSDSDAFGVFLLFSFFFFFATMNEYLYTAENVQENL